MKGSPPSLPRGELRVDGTARGEVCARRAELEEPRVKVRRTGRAAAGGGGGGGRAAKAASAPGRLERAAAATLRRASGSAARHAMRDSERDGNGDARDAVARRPLAS